MIKITGLYKNYGELTAINNLNLQIKAGEIYGLLGPNGAGKTTLINLISNMLKADEGQIEIFGLSTEKNIISIKARMGIVPQNLALYEDLTAYENVKFFASLYGLKGKKLDLAVKEALEFVGLSSNRKRAKTFSGGMKRRLNIACAIAHKPELIIMDEPTVGIDPQSKHHILNAVKSLNKKGTTVIYTTHLMEEAEFLCTRVGIIDYGQLIAEGTVDSLQEMVTDKKQIVIEVVDATENFKRIEEIQGVESVYYEKNQLVIDCLKTSNVIKEIVNTLSEMSVEIKGLNTKELSLESTFLSLTGRRLRD